MAVEVEKNGVVISQLADQLTEGFNALSSEYRLLLDKHKQLEEQLEWAKQQHLDILQRLDRENSDADHRAYLHELEGTGNPAASADVEWLERLSEHRTAGRRSNAYLIMQAGLACENLRKHAAIRSADGVKIWNGASADPKVKIETAEDRNMLEGNDDVLSPLEKDFTVAGTPSKLGCPFSRTNSMMRQPKSILKGTRSTTTAGTGNHRSSTHSKRSSFHDPIQAEICGADEKAPEVAVEEAQQAVCPIRFLDQHKPEEVAAYFEKHKHELPRSHEICVKRFQSNADQIRQLDNKYGNLVNMIQGLGQKHQPMLPAEPAEDEERIEEREADDKIKKWAKTVSTSLQNGEGGAQELSNGVDSEAIVDDDRQSHFDRPLKEVRVGESPSRPWGIQVPLKFSKDGSVVSHQSQPTASPQLPQEAANTAPAAAPKKCPFDHTKMSRPTPSAPVQMSDHPKFGYKPVHHDVLPDTPVTSPPAPPRDLPPQEPPRMPPNFSNFNLNNGTQHQQSHQQSQQPSQMVFHGPVFFGYSPDAIRELLGGNIGMLK